LCWYIDDSSVSTFMLGASIFTIWVGTVSMIAQIIRENR
jgi:hypothetical protein